MSHRGFKQATKSVVTRVKPKVDLESLVMLRDDGTNDAEWFHSLDIYFQAKYDFIGFCLSDPAGYAVRTTWADQDFIDWQAASGATAVQLAALRRTKWEEVFDSRKEDETTYPKMCGVIMSTLSLASQRTLTEDPGYAAVAALRRPRELVALIRSAIVTQSAGLSVDAKADVMIRRWQTLKCGDREDCGDFCARAEELWNALTVANHPEKPALPAAVRFVTKLLSGNSAYGPYVADTLNKFQNPVTAPGAFAVSFATIPSAARRYVSTGPRPFSRPSQAFAYATSEACSECGNPRHTADQCWILHPELKPDWATGKKKAEAKGDPKPSAGETKEKKSNPKKGKKKGKQPSVTAYGTLTEDMAFGLDM